MAVSKAGWALLALGARAEHPSRVQDVPPPPGGVAEKWGWGQRTGIALYARPHFVTLGIPGVSPLPLVPLDIAGRTERQGTWFEGMEARRLSP